MRSRLLILFIATIGVLNADPVNDSIQAILSAKQSDSLVLVRLVTLGRNLKNKPQQAIEVLANLKSFSEKLKNKKDQASANRKIGVLYGELNDYDKAIEYTYRAMRICDELNDRMGTAYCCNNIANYYQSKGKLTGDTVYYNKALTFHLKNISLRKELNDTSWLYLSYSNASIAYIHLKDFEHAIEILNISYNYYKDKTYASGAMRMVNSNLGDAYIGKAKKTGRPEYFRKALSYLNELVNDYRKGKDVHEDFADALEKSGEIYFETYQYQRSMQNLTDAFNMYQEIRNNQGISSTSLLLAKLYEHNGDFKTANRYYGLHVAHKDTVLNRLNKSNIEQMEMLYQSSKKDKEIEKLKTDKELQSEKLKKQRTVTFATLGGLLLLCVLGIVLLRSYYMKRKANLKLTHAYHSIELKNQQITESINYAKRLQNAIIPPVELLKKELSHFFLFYSPRDIVSGDFYWFTKHKDKILFAVADCTGHGVPGALMSMVGNTLLNEIVNHKNILAPGEILDHLHAGISLALRQQKNGDILAQDDGMDISIIVMDEKKRNSFDYACANHSIFLRTGNNVKVLNGDIFSIGGSLGNSNKGFNTFHVEAEAGSFIVMSTDGYPDQFGGTKNSKFLITRFEEFIALCNLETNADSSFEKVFNEWKGEHKQTDDVLVAGFSV